MLKIYLGTLKHGPGTIAEISLSWPADEDDIELRGWPAGKYVRLEMYRCAFEKSISGIALGQPEFRTPPLFRALTTFHEDVQLMMGARMHSFREIIFVSLR